MANAALLGSAYAASVVSGRLAAGTMLDRFPPGAVAAVFTAVPALAAVYFATRPDSVFGPIMVAVCILGLAHGSESDFLAFFSIKRFSDGLYGRVFGLSYGITQLSAACFGVIFSVLFDRTGDYVIACWVTAVCFVSAALAVGRIDIQKPRIG
jgi:predicted MFS family arabinose efflux permease